MKYQKPLRGDGELWSMSSIFIAFSLSDEERGCYHTGPGTVKALKIRIFFTSFNGFC
jgi:hypothetical protein